MLCKETCKGTLVFLGLGLQREHLTQQAIKELRRADTIFLETYTSIPWEGIIDFIKDISGGKNPRKITRKDLEEDNAEILFKEIEKGKYVVLAVLGDPFQATTHSILRVEAKKRGYPTKYVPGINIYSYAVSLSGLYNYKFGAKATIVYPRWGILSEHPLNILKENRERGLHTFFFLDLDPELGPMKPDTALKLLLEVQDKRKEKVVQEDEGVLVLERLGWPGERILYISVKETINKKWDKPPYSLIIPGKLNNIEKETVELLWGRNNG